MHMTELAVQKVRYGILGFGSFAERVIAPAIRASLNADLVAIQKRSLAEAEAKARKYQIPGAYDSAEALVADPLVDAVFVVSANREHCRETVAAAKAGKHVLVEKPMAMNSAEAEEMIDICSRQGVKLMVAHMIRFSPLARRMRDLVQSGAIGTVTFARAEFIYDGRMSQRSWLFDGTVAGGGPIVDIGVHCLDTMRFVLADEVTAVQSTLHPLPDGSRVESTAEIALKFSRGTVGSIYCSYAAPIRRTTIEVVGTEGILSAPDFLLGGQTIPLTIDQGKDSRPQKASVEKVNVPNLYIEEVTHFSECILEGRNPISPGANGLANQRVLDQALRGKG
jgi:predicted dehydrogenase